MTHKTDSAGLFIVYVLPSFHILDMCDTLVQAENVAEMHVRRHPALVCQIDDNETPVMRVRAGGKEAVARG